MSTKKSDKISFLANRLAEDARRRGLKVGDRFLSALEASTLLGISRATAHRALAELAERGIVVRAHKSGTFMSASFEPGPEIATRTIHFLVPEDVDSPFLKDFVKGALHEMPEAGVRLAGVPAQNRELFFRQLVALGEQPDFVGFVPMSCPREVYEFLAERHYPAVILGTPFAEDFPLPSVDADQPGHARHLAGHLIARGHRRLAVVASLPGRPGSNLFVDSIVQVMTEAQLPPNALTIRYALPDWGAVLLQIKELLKDDDRPTGLIVTDAMTGVVQKAVQEVGLQLGRDVEMVVECISDDGKENIPFPHSRPILTAAETMAEAVRMLHAMAEGRRPDPFRKILPVQLQLPRLEVERPLVQ